MIRDRGLIKWQPAHFMPEQAKMLKDLKYEENKHKKPQLDEQAFENMGIKVIESLNYTLPIKITIWKDGYFKNYIGIIDKVDPLMKYILLQTDENTICIMIDDITALERN